MEPLLTRLVATELHPLSETSSFPPKRWGRQVWLEDLFFRVPPPPTVNKRAVATAREIIGSGVSDPLERGELLGVLSVHAFETGAYEEAYQQLQAALDSLRKAHTSVLADKEKTSLSLGEYLIWEGEFLYRTGHLLQAIESLDEVVTLLFPPCSDRAEGLLDNALYWRVAAYHASHDFPAAVEDIEAIADLNSVRLTRHCILLLRFRNLEMYMSKMTSSPQMPEEALADMEELLADSLLSPVGRSLLHLLRAELLQGSNRRAEAVQDMESLRPSVGKFPATYFLKWTRLLFRLFPAETLASEDLNLMIQRADLLGPDQVAALRTFRGYQFAERKQYKEAREDFLAAEPSWGDRFPNNYSKLIDVLFILEAFPEVVAVVGRALEANVFKEEIDRLMAQFQRAQALLRLGRGDEAFADLECVVHSKTVSATIRSRAAIDYGVLLVLREAYTAAIQTFTAILEIPALDPRMQLTAHYNRAVAYLRMEALLEAKTDLLASLSIKGSEISRDERVRLICLLAVVSFCLEETEIAYAVLDRIGGTVSPQDIQSKLAGLKMLLPAQTEKLAQFQEGLLARNEVARKRREEESARKSGASSSGEKPAAVSLAPPDYELRIQEIREKVELLTMLCDEYPTAEGKIRESLSGAVRRFSELEAILSRRGHSRETAEELARLESLLDILDAKASEKSK